MTDYDTWQDLLYVVRSAGPDSRNAIVELARATQVLGPNSIALIRDVVRRLVQGIPMGDWENAPPLVKAAIEETVDAVDYVTVEINRRRSELAALERARTKIIAADAALRECEGLADTERPPAEPLQAGG